MAGSQRVASCSITFLVKLCVPEFSTWLNFAIQYPFWDYRFSDFCKISLCYAASVHGGIGISSTITIPTAISTNPSSGSRQQQQQQQQQQQAQAPAAHSNSNGCGSKWRQQYQQRRAHKIVVLLLVSIAMTQGIIAGIFKEDFLLTKGPRFFLLKLFALMIPKQKCRV